MAISAFSRIVFPVYSDNVYCDNVYIEMFMKTISVSQIQLVCTAEPWYILVMLPLEAFSLLIIDKYVVVVSE